MGHWSIYSLEEAKLDRQGLKALIAGKQRSHSFLALVDEDSQEIMRELHFGGYATDGSVADRYAANPMNIMATLADNAGLSSVFSKAADKLGFGEKLVRFKGTQTSKRHELKDFPESKRQLCLLDEPENVLARWNAACKAAIVLNEADIPTLSMETARRSTVNCRSGTRMALEVMELPAVPVMADYNPGWNRRLRDEVPGLRDIKPGAERGLTQLVLENIRLKDESHSTRPHAQMRLSSMSGVSALG